MLDMATVPREPIPMLHHGRKRWTSKWMGADGKQHAHRFGDVADIPKRRVLVLYADWMQSWRRQAKREAACGSRFTARHLAQLGRDVMAGTGSAINCNLAMRDYEEVFGDRLAEEVSGPEIASLRDNVFMFRWKDGEPVLDKDGAKVIQTARTVNYRLWCVKRAYRAARERGGVSAETLLDVLNIAPVNPKAGKAKASRKVLPVPEATIDATQSHCTSVLSDMIEFQRLTGCRPSEVCNLRPCDLEMPEADPPVWFYVPPKHKTEHADKERVAVLTPEAVALVSKYLDRPTTAFCFSPREHAAKIRKGGRAKYTGVQFTHTTYRRAVEWACKRAGIPAWQPNQVRHRWATEVRRQLGLQVTSEGLSHSSTSITEVYAQQSRERLRDLALQLKRA